jgi:hypothetical protein
VKWDTLSPCSSCPYRTDAQPAKWAREEFDNLQAQDADPLNGGVFGCHATIKHDPPSNCAGWLLDQQRRGLPSIQLRLALIRNPEARDCLDKVSDGGHELYESIEDMVAAQGYE